LLDVFVHEDLVETIHGKVIVDRKISRCHHYRNTRKSLCVPSASHFARHEAGEQNKIKKNRQVAKE
jgi:hypothetical protein